MQDQRCKKEGRSYSLQCGPEGNGRRRLGRGMSPVGPTTSKGALPVGQPTLKAAACVQVLTKPRLCSFSTMWNFAGNLALQAIKSSSDSRTRGGFCRNAKFNW